MPPKHVVLNVAEKNSVARGLAEVFAGAPGSSAVRRENGKHKNCPVYIVENFMFPDPTVRGGNGPDVPHTMVVTSVMGHIMETDFPSSYNNWSATPPETLFDAPVESCVPEKFMDIERELEQRSKQASLLLLWLDCDREGEAIAEEVQTICVKANQRIPALRPRFSTVLPAEIRKALRGIRPLDKNAAAAVVARQEVDLKTGAVFTRFMTLRYQKKYGFEKPLSYGSCQFPTLGFVVERWARIETFIPENFYVIKLSMKDPSSPGTREIAFHWKRDRLYDHLATLALYQLTLESSSARVVSTEGKETSKWRPVPLATVELQMRASKFLRIGSEATMTAAEKLYHEGLISYPRTETDKFPAEFNLQEAISRFRSHTTFGQFATKLLENNGFAQPRAGQHDDHAHPPITPCKAVALDSIPDANMRKIYELVCKHFLACCSKDARGQQTVITVQMGTEFFTARGLMVTEENWLEIYKPYEHWSAGAGNLPRLENGQEFEPAALEMESGSTQPPTALSEHELISEMNTYQIGTDATIAQHIKKILEREYAYQDASQRFHPTDLGIALVKGYNAMGYQLNKPHLRREMEAGVNAVASGQKPKQAFIDEQLNIFRQVFEVMQNDVHKLDAEMAKKFGDAIVGSNDENSRLLQASFSYCKCGAMMDHREVKPPVGANKNNNGTPDQLLFCSTCQKGNALPSKGLFTPAEENCLADDCGFQLVKQCAGRDFDKQETLFCPSCRNIPRQELFKCPFCAARNTLGHIQLSMGEAKVKASCSNWKKENGCSYTVWLPKWNVATISVADPADNCDCGKGGAPTCRKLKVAWRPGANVPPEYTMERESTICILCDSHFRETFSAKLPIDSATGAGAARGGGAGRGVGGGAARGGGGGAARGGGGGRGGGGRGGGGRGR